ncbi:MAG: addiction module protein [Polyangiaceae bacterium]
MDVGELEAEILKLDAQQRARLAAKLLASLEEHCDLEYEQLWVDAALRRDQELEREPQNGRPADDVFGRLGQDWDDAESYNVEC